jgi:class 3 adenylate cyclase
MFQKIKNLKSLKITSKLAIIVAFPIFGLICFTVIITLEKRQVVNEMDALEALTDFAVKSSALVHELQKERGLSAGFLGHQRKKFKKPLEEQRVKTDEAIRGLEDFLKGFHFQAFKQELKHNQETLFNALNRLGRQRQQIDTLNIVVEKEIRYYSQIIHTLLTGINYLSKIITDVQLSNQVVAYVNLLQAKEKAGIERATLSNAFSEGQFASGLYNRFILLVGAQETYIENFYLFATRSQKQRYQATMQNPFFEAVEEIRKQVVNKQLKLKLTLDLRTHLGYGGLIHQFKNYILRGQTQYIEAFYQEYESIFAILSKFHHLPNTSQSDLNAIAIIKNTFEAYKEHLIMAIELKKQNKPVNQIDALIQIDDAPAIEALKNLLSRTHLGIAPDYWWEIATAKINLLKALEDEFSSDLKNYAEILKTEAQNTFLFYLFITAGMIFLTLFYTKMVLKETNEAYARFVPNEFLHLLGEDDRLVNIQLGNCLEMNMTILFADIRSFTTLSEKMSPQENFNFINAYLKKMGPIIRKHNGFVDKYIGDAIMALFINANDALNAAIAMLKELEQFNQKENIKTPIKIGIGLNTGKLMLGIIGEENRLQGTVIGDAVNLASRIESLTKTYESFLIMSQETLENLTHSEQYTIRFLDNLKVKGRSSNVNIFEVLDTDEKALENAASTLTLFEEAVHLYQRQRFSQALTLLEMCLNNNPDDAAAKVYIQRCKRFLHSHQNKDYRFKFE